VSRHRRHLVSPPFRPRLFQGMSQVTLGTTEDNTAACRAYEATGFRCFDRRMQLDMARRLLRRRKSQRLDASRRFPLSAAQDISQPVNHGRSAGRSAQLTVQTKGSTLAGPTSDR
jgi:hypothetical protein